MDAEVELSGGRVSHGVVRIGDTVHRPAGPWTPTVHAFLRHLEERGYRGAPRVLGFDEQGREVLTYIDGVVASSSSWTRGHGNKRSGRRTHRQCLVEVARLIRELHDASADFRPANPVWSEHAYPMLPAEVACHSDLGPHNTVYRDGLPLAFIDWDGARPNEPLLEFGMAAWWYVPLMGDSYCAEMGFAEPPDRGRRLRALRRRIRRRRAKSCSRPSARPSSERRSGPATGRG